MANTKLVFLGSEISETEQHELVCFANDKNEIYIQIDMPGFETSWLCLDRGTSIKLHRELKKQISFIEREVNNG